MGFLDGLGPGEVLGFRAALGWMCGEWILECETQNSQPEVLALPHLAAGTGFCEACDVCELSVTELVCPERGHSSQELWEPLPRWHALGAWLASAARSVLTPRALQRSVCTHRSGANATLWISNHCKLRPAQSTSSLIKCTVLRNDQMWSTKYRQLQTAQLKAGQVSWKA